MTSETRTSPSRTCSAARSRWRAPSQAIWDFHGIYATSRHIPGVRYAGITHPGLFGTAPSAELLAKWNQREQQLINTNPNRVPPLALPPTEEGVLAGLAKG